MSVKEPEIPPFLKRAIEGSKQRVDIFLRCSPEFKAEVQAAAAREGKTVSHYMQEAIEAKMKG